MRNDEVFNKLHLSCITILTVAIVITVPLLVGWAQERHWLPHYSTQDCNAYQRDAPHCQGWYYNTRRD